MHIEFRKAKNTNLRTFAIIALKTFTAEDFCWLFRNHETFQHLTGKRSVQVSWNGSLKPGAMSDTHFVDEMRGRLLHSP